MNTARSIVNATSNVIDCTEDGYTLPRCVVAEGARIITTTAIDAAATAAIATGGPLTVVAATGMYAFSDKIGNGAASIIRRSGTRTILNKRTDAFVNIPKEVTQATTNQAMRNIDTSKLVLPPTNYVPEMEEILKKVSNTSETVTNITIDIDTKNTIIDTLDSAIVLLNAAGHKDLVQAAIVTKHMFNIYSQFEAITTAATFGNVFGLVAGTASLICSLFGNNDSDNTVAELQNLIITAFNEIMGRIAALETAMHGRFDALETRMDKQHYAVYMGLRELYHSGKTIEFVLRQSTRDIIAGLGALGLLTDWYHEDLKSYFGLISDNLNSFRFERINELIAQIDYDIETERLTEDRIHDYLAKLHNVITNVLKNEQITGSAVASETLTAQFSAICSTEPARLVNYIATKLGLAPVVNPILWLVVDKYARTLVDKLVTRNPFHTKMLATLTTQAREYEEFVIACKRLLPTYVAQQQKVIDGQMAVIETARNARMQALRVAVEHRRTTAVEELAESIDALHHMNLFAWYTEEATKMYHGNAVCSAIYNDYVKRKPDYVPFIKMATYCTGSFCNGEYAKRDWRAYQHSERHGYCDNCDKDITQRPTTRCSKSSDMDYIASHPENYIATKRMLDLRKLRLIIPTMSNLHKARLIVSVVRPYAHVKYADVTVKLPIPILYNFDSKLCEDIAKWNCGQFTIDCTIGDDNIELYVNFVDSDNRLYKLQKNVFPRKFKPSTRNNKHETLLDFYMGGPMAHEGHGVEYASWHWDRSPNGCVRGYVHDYAESYEHVPGIVDQLISISMPTEFVTTINERVRAAKEALETALAATVDSKQLILNRRLLEAEQTLITNL